MRHKARILTVMAIAISLALVALPTLATPEAFGASQTGLTNGFVTPVSDQTQPISPEVAAALTKLEPSQQISVVVTLKDQANLSGISGRTRAEREKSVILALQHMASSTQRPLLSLLNARQKEGSVSAYRAMWIMNAISVTATGAVIEELAQQPAVGQITLDAVIHASQALSAVSDTPSKSSASSTSTTSLALAPASQNLDVVNAPSLWNLGYYGQGVVVASMDTGVDYTQPDLSAQWRGGTDSWYDPYGQHATPFDSIGHGTWTMGVILGGDSSGATLGVAPQAQWIAAKIFNDQGIATTSAIHLAYQWALDPDGDPNTPDAPNVVNNSWTYSNVNGCDLTFETDLANLAAAGIVSVFAAGNYGPNSSTSVSPANNPDAFAVGGVDDTDAIDPESGRGPTTCGGVTRTYPDVVAPGVGITTTDLAGGYTTVTGTSIAAPHITGGLALLLNAFPDLTVDQQRAALTLSSVDLGDVGPDNTFGAGRIDLLGAYNLIASEGLPTPTPTPSPTPTATSTPTPSGAIFSDGYDSGSFSAWSSCANCTGGSSGRITASAAAAQAGAYGMQAVLSGGVSGYVQDNSPSAETTYHARFYFDPNGATIGTTPITVFVGLNASNAPVFTIQARKTTHGGYQISAVVTRANKGSNTTSWYTVSSNTFTAIEIAWQSGASASFSIYIGGALIQTLTKLDTSTQLLETVQLGPQGSLSGTSGTMYFDSFASTRDTLIGL